MSDPSRRRYGPFLGGVEMQPSRSTDSINSYNTNMSNGEAQSVASPYTALSSSFDPQSPYLDVGYDHAYDYQQSEGSTYAHHDDVDNHLALCNPNGILPQNTWVMATYDYEASVNLGYHEDDQQLSLVIDHNIRPTPRSLGWSKNDSILKMYCFQVNKGKDPYFQLRDEKDVSDTTPHKVYLDSSCDVQRKSYECTFPGNDKRCHNRRGGRITFTRPADLERHYRHIHTPKEQQETFICGYANCTRKENNPFTRKDHYRDHLRDYHKEDLGEAKRTKKDTNWHETQRIWEAERIINSRNWRCVKCLHNNRVQKGWACTECKTQCDADRREKRMRLAEREAYDAVAKQFACVTCRDSGWVDLPGTCEPCPSCHTTDYTGYMDFDMGTYESTAFGRV